jgi:uncharacterized protein YkwD
MLIALTATVLAAAVLGPGSGVASARARAAKQVCSAQERGSCPATGARARARRGTAGYARHGSAGAVARRGAAAPALRHSAAKARHLNARRAATARETGSSQAAALARVLATPCANTQLMPEAANLGLLRQAVLCLVNQKRAQNGELPLAEDAKLDAAAESHNQDMVAAGYFEHVSPSGETPVDRVRASGYLPTGPAGYVIGENLAWGTLSLATPQAIVAAWIASPGHLANILESQYRDTGIAITPAVPRGLADGVAGATYAQEFGVIAN